jgi:ABC-type oligopeptide transport system ATPase subunit
MALIPCEIKMVFLKKNEEEIPYGDMTNIAKALPKTKVINGVRVEIEYTKEMVENWQHKYTDSIVEELNDLLPNACLKQKTMYYFSKLVPTNYEI